MSQALHAGSPNAALGAALETLNAAAVPASEPDGVPTACGL